MTKVPPAPRADVVAMTGYTPGEQPRAGERSIKLNTNENPYPPSPAVMAAIATLEPEGLRRYPSPLADEFREIAAQVHGVTPDMVVTGNGSDEILSMVLRTFCAAGDVLAYPHPTYSLYPVLAGLAQLKVAEVPWEPNWTLPTEGLLAAGPKAIFFANPNAPSGTVVPPLVIADLAARFAGIVLVDEAYIDFADVGTDALGLLKSHPNVIVTRTLSKGYSLAGLRFGYAISHPATICQLLKMKDSYNCDSISIVAATAALRDRTTAQASWQAVQSERARLREALIQRGFDVPATQTNFLLTAVPGGDGNAVYQKLKAAGILIRFFDKPGLRDKVRITVGTPAQDDELLAVIDR